MLTLPERLKKAEERIGRPLQKFEKEAIVEKYADDVASYLFKEGEEENKEDGN